DPNSKEKFYHLKSIDYNKNTDIITLLQIEEEEKNDSNITSIRRKRHYVYVKDISRLLSCKIAKEKNKLFYCLNCFTRTRNIKAHELHIKACSSLKTSQIVEMPKEKSIYFKN